MPLVDGSAWALLRELDDPVHLEFPRDYDHGVERARFERLVVGLARRFGCACAVDRNVQDASHHGDVGVPAGATAGGEPITVRVSNFGGMAVVSLGLPGGGDEREEPALFDGGDRRAVEEELGVLGYRVIPRRLLRERYDGVVPFPGGATWWIRFFDYL
ncbi:MULTISPECIES: hypothetical protein [Actinosynnema]|uniref:hypothetical protein n=1 Tax=Actinosynnema TaxID=40566 RepID=UPI0020A329EE|nr:hypothetical protein [Actinosynnema pretiosum]MCP2096182.1 hypothetical protein [Actinosynnema pretiosum]